MLKRGGRLIAVGDRHQAIYGFTGADADALDLIGDAVSAVRMPLTVTYRCPKAVVKYAHQYVSHINAHKSAPEGIVRNITTPLIQEAKSGDAILCRFNAPLVKYAYSFIAAGIAVKVEGREIGTGLKTLARRWKSKTFTQLLDNLDKYQDRETAKYRAKEQESKAVGVEDKVTCLKILINRIQSTKIQGSPVDLICAEVDKIFADNVGDDVVLLSSIHKSKGREWTNVFWLQTGPSKWARKDWELDQENNLCYVAATRAKFQLILVPEENKRKKKDDN